MIVTNILVILIAICLAYYDSTILNVGKYIYDHTSRAIVRGITLAGVSFVPIQEGIIEYFLIFTINCTIFWIVFDILINIMTDKSPYYIGGQAKTDKMARNLFGNDGFLYLKYKFAFLMIMYFIYLFYIGAIQF